ncbi:hypothetical protein [Aeromicrobium sp. 50.2.37]|uniref:hypothetical protein n=1 Tax=Aeromicrobium sp. 50.2.37 TaxID=2969305 RepID=UPI00214FA93A|nr:hypothetical protein [Aeromicrobium sp. 50.2.37]MCR4512313.1 hypothetical protein [Aeromicrobium sp. 50.2.37]
MAAWRRTIVLQWSLLLAVLIGLPWFRSGFVLSYDMVWVPRLDLGRPDLWGLGSALPRAVPSDAVVAVLGAVVDPQLVQRLVLLGALLLAGVGGARLVASAGLAGRLAAATLAIWNPYVLERLAIGQWPMLLGYAAILWLVAELRRDDPRLRTVVLALAGTALTPAGGLMGLAVGLLAGARFGLVRITVLAAVLNAPWLVSSFLQGSVRADPGGVEAFALRSEGLLGHVGTAFSLGGIWNADVVPEGRGSMLVVVLTVTVWALALLGLGVLARTARPDLVAVLLVAVAGLAVAFTGWLAPTALEDLVAAFGPAAVLRDGARYLALLAPALVVGFGVGIDRLVAVSGSRGLAAAPAVAGLLLPLAILPALAVGIGGRLEPVQYPGSWETARLVVERSTVPGDLAVLPFTAYRAPSWNAGRPVLDPAGRFFDRPTVTDDRLVVSGCTVAGEDPRAAAVRRALASEDVPRALARLGIGLVVLDTTAPDADRAARSVRGLELLGGTDLRVYAVEGAKKVAVDDTDRAVMTGVWVVWAVVVGAALAGSATGAARRLGGSLASRGSERQAAEQRPRHVPKT